MCKNKYSNYKKETEFMNFGNRLKELRLLDNLTQDELAKIVNTSRSNIANYENNKNMPSKKILVKMCEIFNCSMDFLIGLTSEVKTAKRFTDKKQSRLEQILELVNGLNIQEANYLIKQLNKAKIYIEKEDR